MIPGGKLVNRYCRLCLPPTLDLLLSLGMLLPDLTSHEGVYPTPIPQCLEAQLRAMIKVVKIPLILEQNRCEVHGSTYTWNFFNSKDLQCYLICISGIHGCGTTDMGVGSTQVYVT